MLIEKRGLTKSTQGRGTVVDLTQDASDWLHVIAAGEGQLTVFVPGSTAAVTTIEYESGCVADLEEALEQIAPSDRGYQHDNRWGDGNGYSHLRAALLGPSLVVPVSEGRCCLGTWQQIVLVDCDARPRDRKVIFSFVGSEGKGD
ncbi:MAG: YjbQ family protein [bacterium]|nr:YjbQ family protein [bacterium]